MCRSGLRRYLRGRTPDELPPPPPPHPIRRSVPLRFCPLIRRTRPSVGGKHFAPYRPTSTRRATSATTLDRPLAPAGSASAAKVRSGGHAHLRVLGPTVTPADATLDRTSRTSGSLATPTLPLVSPSLPSPPLPSSPLPSPPSTSLSQLLPPPSSVSVVPRSIPQGWCHRMSHIASLSGRTPCRRL